MKFKKEFIYHVSSIEKRSVNTVNNYIREIEAFCQWLKETTGKDILEATTDDIDMFTGYCTVDLGNKSSSINKKISSLSKYYKYCQTKKHISVNPVVGAVRQKVKNAETTYLTEEEVEQLLNAILQDKRKGTKGIAKIRDYAMIQIFISCGLRVSELCNLKPQDISYKKLELRVIGGKGDKDRTIPLGPNTIQNIKNYLKIREEFNPNCENLFVNNHGNAFVAKTVNKKIASYCKLAELEENKIHAHSLRHSCATFVYNETGDIVVVQELLGHSNIDTTRRYIKQSQERYRNGVLSNKFA